MKKIIQSVLILIFCLYFLGTVQAHEESPKSLMEQSLEISKKTDQSNPLASEFRQKSLEYFGGINSISTKPLLLTNQEYSEIQNDMKLLLEALTQFYTDHFSGNRAYEKANIVPIGLMNYILQDYWYHEPNLDLKEKHRNNTAEIIPTKALQKSSPQKPQLTGGPDIVFTKDGPKILELNFSTNLGGLASIDASREFFFNESKAHQKLLKSHYKNNAFINSFFDYAKYRADKHKGKPAILFANAKYNSKEQQIVRTRLEDRLRKAGFIILEMPYTDPLNIEKPITYSHEFESSKLGVFAIDRKTQKSTKLGFIFPYMTMFQFKSLGQNAFFIQANKKARIDLAISPGGEIFSDKRLLPYLKALVSFYTGKNLSVSPPRTENFMDYQTHKIREDVFYEVFLSPKDWVIKEANSSGGNGVWLGTDLAKNMAELERLSNLVKANPENFLAQRHVDINTRGDLRLIVSSDGKSHYISPTGWSRKITPGLKANTSGQAGKAEFNAVFVESNSFKSCLKAFLAKKP